jgi:hypothetical protein
VGTKFKKGENGEIIVLLHMLIKKIIIKKKKGKRVIFYTCQIEFKWKRKEGNLKELGN